MRTESGTNRRVLVERICDNTLLEEIVRNDPYTLAGEAAVLNLTNRELLSQLAKEDPAPLDTGSGRPQTADQVSLGDGDGVSMGLPCR